MAPMWLVVSHGLVILACFTVGWHYGRLLSSTTACERSKGALQTTTTPSASLRLDRSVVGYFGGLARVDRREFLETFDTGQPSDHEYDEYDVLMVYDGITSHPLSTNRTQLQRLSLDEATRHCLQVRVLTIDPTVAGDTCLLLQGNLGEPHHFVHRWQRHQNGQYQKVSAYAPHLAANASSSKTLLADPPKPVVVREAQHVLREYLARVPVLTQSLEPLLVSLVGRVPAGQPRRHVVVMVVNDDHWPLLENFLCATKAMGERLERTLVFSLDEATHERVREAGLASFLLNVNLPSSAVYGTLEYARIVMAKVWSVHLVNRLGYNVWFVDVDMIPFRPGAWDYLFQVADRYRDFDVVLQDDHTRDASYAPWSANSGLYHVRANAKTTALMHTMVRSGDVMLRTKSHQATLSMVLSEYVSHYGLRVKVLTEESYNLPVGYHFHQDKAFMKDVLLGQIQPYLLHMNWNLDRQTKQQFMEQLGVWYVKPNCQKDCCRTQPEPVCYYRDKPSKLPTCFRFPALERDESFW